MHTRLIYRLVTATGGLLGWTEQMALAKGDGRLWSTDRVTIPIDAEGEPFAVSIHWPDVNVETCPPVTALPSWVHVGDTVTIYGVDIPVLVVGPMPGVLPPVTVKTSVSLSPPTGGMGLYA